MSIRPFCDKKEGIFVFYLVSFMNHSLGMGRHSIVKSSDSRTFPGGLRVKNLPPNADFPGGSVSKESVCNSRDLGLIPGLGRSPGEGNGNPLQYSCLEIPVDGGAWRATNSWGCKELDTTE